MTFWVRVGISTALVACSSRTPSGRERALERIPATAQVILAAEGAALATPAFQAVVDSLRSHLPPSLACVVEAATTSDAIAVGADPETGATIVLVTRAAVSNCPALSQIAAGVWTATIGAGVVAADRAHSVLAAPLWERARPYLVREPIAIAAERPELRLVAVAQPEPLDAWLAIDATESASIEQRIKAQLARWQAPLTSELAGKLKLARTGTQVSVQADGLTVADLVTIAGEVVTQLEAAPAVPAAPTVTCAPTGGAIVSCRDGTHYTVTSLDAIVTELAAVRSAPVIAGGDITGIRMLAAPPQLLAQDDVILGVGSHRITSSNQLRELARSLEGRASIAVRRGGRDVVLELVETP